MVVPPVAGVATAAPQDRITVTSSSTGVTYSATHSCAGLTPRFSARGGDRVVELALVLQRPGKNDVTGFDFVGGDKGRTRALGFSKPDFIAVDPGSTWVVRERFEGEAAYRDVLTITPQNCPDYAASPLSMFSPITPTRLLDTRPGFQPDFSGPRPASGTVIDIPATSFPSAPDDVVAVSLTVSLAGSDDRGFVQVFPTGKVEPGGTANVNSFAAGQTVGNLAVVPVGNGGGISLFTSVGGHLIVDVNGYFVTSGEKSKSGRLETIDSKRMFDSRSESPVNSAGGPLAAGQTVTVDLTSIGSGLPAGATAAIVNVTATRSTAAGFVQAAAGGSLVPGASAITNVNRAGQTRGGLSIVPLAADGSIDIHSSGGADVIVDLTGWFTGEMADEDDRGLFVPLDPERVYDTRTVSIVNYESSGDVTSRVPFGTERVALGAISPKASAVFLNATVINPQEVGFVQFQGGRPLTTSNVNHTAGSVVANASVVTFKVPTSSNVTGTNSVSVNYSDGTRGIDLTIDMAGYFTK